jgi:hypothetical protein
VRRASVDLALLTGPEALAQDPAARAVEALRAYQGDGTMPKDPVLVFTSRTGKPLSRAL